MTPAPQGLLVGRVERRAWLRELRGADDEYSLYLIRIGFDPAEISPYELVIEIQEWAAGELAVARRLALEWLDLSGWSGEDHVDLVLPILGRGAKRSVSLYDLGGELLDISRAGIPRGKYRGLDAPHRTRRIDIDPLIHHRRASGSNAQ